MNARKNMGIEIIATSDEGGDLYQMRMVESGEAAAFFYDDAVMAGERVMAKNPGDLVIVGAPQSFEAYGCMFRMGDARFKKLVDETIAQAQTSGTALESYNKWFMNPIPPDNVNLEYPLSDPMKALFANPNDKAFQ
jgi:glutamate/aspartate transport system substrate-binding protein